MRAALIASLWHAPIPWVHFHDLEGPQVEQLDPLSRHVAEFHSKDLAHGWRKLDWHAHLVLPWCLHQHENCPEQQDHAPRPVDVCSVVTAGVASLDSSLASCRLAPAAGIDAGHFALTAPLARHDVAVSATIPECGWPRHFFATYAGSAAVRDLVGVRLC